MFRSLNIIFPNYLISGLQSNKYFRILAEKAPIKTIDKLIYSDAKWQGSIYFQNPSEELEMNIIVIL